MAKSADEKRSKILEVAKRRFAHYGLAKTTMAEIANDLAFSKALLYYYFPDKTSLYKAVIESVADELDEDVRHLISENTYVEEGLLIILKKRIDYVKKYFYIIEYTFTMKKEVTDDISEVLFASFVQQIELVKYVFDLAVKRGEIRPIDTKECASIFINACMGMRMIALKDLKSYFIPDKEEFDSIFELQKKLADIFIYGLKA